MCRIYTAECEGCGASFEVHVGDFSADPNNIHVFCHKPKCREAAMKRLTGPAVGQHIVFTDRRRGARKAVLIVVDRPHDICLNE